MVPGYSSIKGEFVVNSVPNNKSTKLYEGHVYLKKFFLWIIPVNINITKESINFKEGMFPVDCAPGSFIELNADMVGEEMEKKFFIDKFCFIPTTSALAMPEWSTHLNTNFSGKDLYGEKSFPFSSSL